MLVYGQLTSVVLLAKLAKGLVTQLASEPSRKPSGWMMKLAVAF